MKRIIKYIAFTLAGLVLLASCNKNLPPVFDDKNAFVAFDQVNVSVSEDFDGVSRIPVTLASIVGLEETIRFEVSYPEKNAAKEGVNFEVLTKTGTLSFNAENRTQYIEFKTITDGEYTGDLSFNIEIFGTETLNIGSENKCKVVLNDVDHPLSFMLGQYKVKGYDFFEKKEVEWTMEIRKDSKDDHKIWFYNLMGNDGWAGDDMMYYGIVNGDLNSINLPFGQESEYLYQGTSVTLFGCDNELNVLDSGSIDIAMTVNDSSVSLDFGKDFGLAFMIVDVGPLNVYLPGITAVKL